ncbi:hypothetical protein PPACK8108_LOCUS19179 [Phakopsora pachyrhizi]|uniref:Uncharacterized protein n=1 Tax=Phakopsora pachyrhizi TaxID=170000 RepID=A0AAV0BC17_PHAPC|nr:hypothetical protein PPACK8108_LOCUS19179 [Phakopsora pachyrhizi]
MGWLSLAGLSLGQAREAWSLAQLGRPGEQFSWAWSKAGQGFLEGQAWEGGAWNCRAWYRAGLKGSKAGSEGLRSLWLGWAGLGLRQDRESWGMAVVVLGQTWLGWHTSKAGLEGQGLIGWHTNSCPWSKGRLGRAWLLSEIEWQAKRQIDCDLPWCCKGGKQAGFAGLGGMKIGFSGAAGIGNEAGWAWSRAGLGGVATEGLGRVVLGLAGLGLGQDRDTWRSKAGQGHMEGLHGRTETAGLGLGQAWEGGAWLGFYLGLKGRNGGKSIAICLGVAKEAGRQAQFAGLGQKEGQAGLSFAGLRLRAVNNEIKN